MKNLLTALAHAAIFAAVGFAIFAALGSIFLTLSK